MKTKYLLIITGVLVFFFIVFIGQGYTPWVSMFLNLPSSIESLFYAVQAATVALVVAHHFGFNKGKNKSDVDAKKLNSKSINMQTAKKKQNKRNIRVKYAALIIAMIVIFTLPFILNPSADYSGTDNEGSDIITGQGYTPWLEPFLQLGKTAEFILFAVQAAIGGSIIGYFVGYERGKRARNLLSMGAKEKSVMQN